MPRIALELALAGAAPRRLVFDKQELVVGRAGHADVVLDGDQVSRVHCRLTFHDGRWRLTDASSANGVYLDRGGRGAPFLARDDVLVSGDHIYLGRYRLRVDLDQGVAAEGAGSAAPGAEDVILHGEQDRTVLVRPTDMRAEVDGWLNRPAANATGGEKR